jgi:hypothetical protein
VALVELLDGDEELAGGGVPGVVVADGGVVPLAAVVAPAAGVVAPAVAVVEPAVVAVVLPVVVEPAGDAIVPVDGAPPAAVVGSPVGSRGVVVLTTATGGLWPPRPAMMNSAG